MVNRYKKKIIAIEAVQFNGKNYSECYSFMNENNKYLYLVISQPRSKYILIKNSDGNMIAQKGDYIIKGVNGEFYPCKPDIFDKTYEEVRENK